MSIDNRTILPLSEALLKTAKHWEQNAIAARAQGKRSEAAQWNACASVLEGLATQAQTQQSKDSPMERIIVTEGMIARFWEVFTRVTQPSAKTFDAIHTALQVVLDDYTNERRTQQASRSISREIMTKAVDSMFCVREDDLAEQLCEAYERVERGE